MNNCFLLDCFEFKNIVERAKKRYMGFDKDFQNFYKMVNPRKLGKALPWAGFVVCKLYKTSLIAHKQIFLDLEKNSNARHLNLSIEPDLIYSSSLCKRYLFFSQS